MTDCRSDSWARIEEISFAGKNIFIILPRGVSKEEAEQRLEEAVRSLITTVKNITEAWEWFAKNVHMALKAIADAMKDADIYAEEEKGIWERWRTAERVFSQIQAAKHAEFEKKRAGRCAEIRGNVRIGESGRRAGLKKAKMHDFLKRRWENGRNEAN